MKCARLLSLSLLALLSMSPMIAMEQGESSKASQKTKKQRKNLTPEEEKKQLLMLLELTLKKVELAKLQMHYDALVFQAMLPSKPNNNNNAQPTATPAAPVATAPDGSSSNNQAPAKPFTMQDLLNNRDNMNQLIETTSALVDTGITELCDELKSNNNNNDDE